LCASLLTTGGTAHAQATLLQCAGTETDTYAPGVTFQPREFTITLTGQYGSCVDGSGHVTSGSYGPEVFSLDAGCDDLFEGFTATRTFTWNTGDSSVMQGSGQSTEVGGSVVTTITGKIVQGRFQGDSAIQTITLPQPDVLACLTTGYTGATGVATLTLS
jgi:hypothetical protein